MAAVEAKAGSAWVRRGIARGSFEQRFALAEHVEVKDATLSNGLLTIALARVVPESLKPRAIPIGSSTKPLAPPAEQAA